jgi:hypothetical protein
VTRLETTQVRWASFLRRQESTVGRMDPRLRGGDAPGDHTSPLGVIPAKVGIQPVDTAFPEASGLDSRLRGNDRLLERLVGWIPAG